MYKRHLQFQNEYSRTAVHKWMSIFTSFTQDKPIQAFVMKIAIIITYTS